MAFLTQAARKNALDGLTINYVLLHDGVPGDNGASNQITGTEQSITLAAATDYQTNDAQRQPSADIEYTELNANQSVTHVSFWEGDPAVDGTFKAWAALTGDTEANSAGEFTITATDSRIYASMLA